MNIFSHSVGDKDYWPPPEAGNSLGKIPIRVPEGAWCY